MKFSDFHRLIRRVRLRNIPRAKGDARNPALGQNRGVTEVVHPCGPALADTSQKSFY